MATAAKLWHIEVSHYNEKVRWAFDYKDVPYTLKTPLPGAHRLTALRAALLDGYDEWVRTLDECEDLWAVAGLRKDGAEARRFESLRRYFADAYVARNFIVVAVGNLEHRRLRALVERAFTQVPVDGSPIEDERPTTSPGRSGSGGSDPVSRAPCRAGREPLRP